MNRLILISFLSFLLSSCSYFLTDHKNDYLKEKQEKALVIPEDLESRPIVDYYPINSPSQNNVGSEYDIPMPQQVFSSGTSNEVRMHKLGEIRWVYVETLPSSAWPMMNDFWVTSGYGLSKSDPTSGIIESDNLGSSEQEAKLVMKVEHGIRQASSEIFISHITNIEGQWIRVQGEENLEEVTMRKVLDYFASTPPSGGTSLVALNLNFGQKASLKQDDNKTNFIELNLEYARAWAAVDRALKEALIDVNDLDREEGVFYVNFSKEEEKGFIRKMFSGDSFKGEYRILVKEIDEKTCRVTIIAQGEEAKAYERELLSEINQSLS
ncbi:MAG: outer membrane protein assembly factor BamC [SAR86 cluster bacterium]|jgi:outer membrane protein assembly factor BamC|nr:outer membrane protein assembly factor BamC [SAR86 cluster bacterium]|tara:strand:+ start:1773 stop:2744 length:972 start_codon:yes stop_codon:yes gene_type:complete